MPLVFIGAGFVIATTVRTAIIFASVPRGLPATAAALNEASISVGARAGIVLTTAIVTQTALTAFEPSLAGLAPAAAEAQRQTFQGLLTVVGTPALAGLTASVTPEDLVVYADAYLVGVRWALFLGGMAAVVGGAVASISSVDEIRSGRCGTTATSERVPPQTSPPDRLTRMPPRAANEVPGQAAGAMIPMPIVRATRFR